MVIIVYTLTSCTTTRYAALNDNPDIEIFTSTAPDRPFNEVNYIEISGGLFHTPQHLVNGLKKKAIEQDADAIINVKFDFQFWWPIVSGTTIKYRE